MYANMKPWKEATVCQFIIPDSSYPAKSAWV